MEGRDTNGKFLPGNTGRPKGSTNKITDDLRGKITDFLNANFETIIEDFQGMKSGYRTKLYVDLLQFALPKLQSSSNKIKFEEMSDDQLQTVIDGLKGDPSAALDEYNVTLNLND